MTRSVPELYNSVGRGGIAALKEEADLERHEAWLAWDQARRNKAADDVAYRKAKEKDNWHKATTEWDACGGQPGCGYKSIAKNFWCVPDV